MKQKGEVKMENAVMEPPVKQSHKRVEATIKPANMSVGKFRIIGTAPLVIHRFSRKVANGLKEKMMAGSTAKKGKKREPFNPEEAYQDARYVSKDGWDGFNAAAIRCAMISACRLVGFKMTLAKLSLFVIADGWDEKESQIPLVRIIGEPRKLESVVWPEMGGAMITVRPCYDKWSADVTIRWDADQFTTEDVANLLERVGLQVGLCEGRPDSKNSAGCGWGTFTVERSGN